MLRFPGRADEGFFAALYRRGELYALSLRGTDDGFDVVPDGQILAAMIPVQMSEAQAAFQESMEVARRKKCKLVLTGHSLGGGLAGLLAMQHTRCAVTFNAPGVARSYSNYSMGLESAFMPYTLAIETATSSTLINIRAMFDPVSVGTGPRLGRVESISVPGCMASWDEFGARLEQLPMDMIMNRSSGEFSPFPGLVTEVSLYILCQHRMELMARQIAKMPEYQHDLGW